jgi:ferritin
MVSCRIKALIRKELLLNRLEYIEEIREKFLDSNDFEAFHTLKNWHEEDWTELRGVEQVLAEMELAEGPVTIEMIIEVSTRLKEIQ